MFLPKFDVLCDILLNRRMTTRNLFLLYSKELNFVIVTPIVRLSSNDHRREPMKMGELLGYYKKTDRTYLVYTARAG